jgi:hypothetical protein
MRHRPSRRRGPTGWIGVWVTTAVLVKVRKASEKCNRLLRCNASARPGRRAIGGTAMISRENPRGEDRYTMGVVNRGEWLPAR